MMFKHFSYSSTLEGFFKKTSYCHIEHSETSHSLRFLSIVNWFRHVKGMFRTSYLLPRLLSRWYILFLILFVSQSFSQQLPFDSTKVRLDTTKVDTLRATTDTLIAKTDSIKAKSGVDTIITYTCTDSIVYHFPNRTMSLYKNSAINYQTMELKSERIAVDWNTNVVSAVGVPDSTDTLHGGFRGTPIMKDGGEQYNGTKLSYNFQTKKGIIEVADTKSGEGFYHGQDIKKVDKDVMFVSNGRFTTCDLPHPHFYFSSPKMKVTMHDEVVAEPVYLYIADVPVFVLPFAVFPNKSGRRSGIIAPAYAEDSQRGRLLRHLGYYWAINDYLDWKVQTDLYTRGSYAIATNFQYNIRYTLRGSLSGEYKDLFTGEQTDPGSTKESSYYVAITHNQDIDPSTSFNANFKFASDNAYRNTIDYNEALEQSISSNASISKRWESPNSISLSISRDQNLQTGNLNWTLPSLNFSHANSYPFRKKKSTEGSSHLAWYEMIGVGYSLNASSGISRTQVAVNNIKTNINGIDTLTSVNEYQKNKSQRIGQGLSFNIAPKVGYININPDLSFSDSRDFSTTNIPVADTSDSSLTYVDKRDAHRSGIVTSGISFNTRLFGIIQPNILGIAAIRHTLSPSVAFSYSNQLYGDNPGSADKHLFGSLRIDNLFEMKTIPASEGKEGTKIQLLNLGLSTHYDFTADSMNLGNLDMSFRTGIGSTLDISGGANYDFYRLVETAPGVYNRINQLLLSAGEGFARLTNFRISFGTSLSGERKKTESTSSEPKDTTTKTQNRTFDARRAYGGMPEPDFSIPWQLQLHWDYGESKAPVFSRSSSLNATLDFNLTEKWKFNFQTGYDFIDKDLVFPRVGISRDLHCWVMNFTWAPIGQYRSYQFEIRVKASELQDLKVTKSGSDIGY